MAGFQLLDFHAALCPGDLEASAGEAEGVVVVTAEGGGGFGVGEDGELVVCEGVAGVMLGAEVVAIGGAGLAEEEDGGVEDVASEFEEAAAVEFRELFAETRAGFFAHHGVNFHDFAEPALPGGFEHELEGGVVAEHVAHLDGESLRLGGGGKFLEVLQVRAGGFVEVDVASGDNCFGCRGDKVANTGLDGDGLQSRDVEECFLGEIVHIFHPATESGVRLNHADQLKNVRKFLDGGEFSLGVGMGESDLTDLDFGRVGTFEDGGHGGDGSCPDGIVDEFPAFHGVRDADF